MCELCLVLLPNLRVIISQLSEHVATLVVEALERAIDIGFERISRQQGQDHRAIDITNNAVGQLLGVNFAPGHGFAGGGTRESTGIGARIGELDEVVVAFFGDAHDFLELGLSLEDEVFR